VEPLHVIRAAALNQKSAEIESDGGSISRRGPKPKEYRVSHAVFRMATDALAAIHAQDLEVSVTSKPVTVTDNPCGGRITATRHRPDSAAGCRIRRSNAFVRKSFLYCHDECRECDTTGLPR
jgi:hypothetical protein